MKNTKYHIAGTGSKNSSKIVESDKFETTNTQIHGRSLSKLGTGTSIKNGGVKLVRVLSFCLPIL